MGPAGCGGQTSAPDPGSPAGGPLWAPAAPPPQGPAGTAEAPHSVSPGVRSLGPAPTGLGAERYVDLVDLQRPEEVSPDALS